MSTSMYYRATKGVLVLSRNISNILKGKCKKWEQKYEIVFNDLNFIIFFQGMIPMTFATIEIGSNAVRMIVGELRDSCELCVIERWSAHLRLGDAVFKRGKISENLFQKLKHTIQGMLGEIQKFPQVKVTLSATSAMREAKNRDEVVARIKSLVGYPIKILSGTEESQCLLDGIKSFLSPSLFQNYPLKQTVLADLGGGSLEISLPKSARCLNGNETDSLYSFAIGTLKLRKMDNPVQELESSFAEKLLQLEQDCSAIHEDRSHLILTGGNAKTFARLFPLFSANLQSEKSSAIQTKNWLSMDWSEFKSIEQILQKESPAEQIERWKLRPQQTEVFNAALAVFKIIGSKLGTKQLSIPFFGLKESLLLGLVSAEIEQPLDGITLIQTYGPPKKYKI